MNLTDYIKDVPNFPKKGIIFKDICPLLKSPEAWTKVMTQLGLFCEETTPDLIIGIESRGFIVGSALATRQRLGFVPIRKSGKLPGNVLKADYPLEYGEDELEIQIDALAFISAVAVIIDFSTTLFILPSFFEDIIKIFVSSFSSSIFDLYFSNLYLPKKNPSKADNVKL